MTVQRARFWLELTTSVVCGLLLALTVAVPDWIERFLGADPDGGSGGTEWGLVLGLALAGAAGAALARRHRPGRAVSAA